MKRIIIIALCEAAMAALITGCSSSKMMAAPYEGGRAKKMQPVAMKVLYVRDGKAYLSSATRTYVMQNDTLKAGDRILAFPCGDSTNPKTLKRIN